MVGCHPLLTSRMLKQTVPDGYTFGWYRTGVNLQIGGTAGYSSENFISSLYVPPSHAVPCFPGMPHCRASKFVLPSPFFSARA